MIRFLQGQRGTGVMALQYALGEALLAVDDSFWVESFDIGKIPVRNFDVQPASAQFGKADT